MRKSNKLKYGVIGLGSMGKHHARIISSLPKVTLAAVSDINNDALASYTCLKFPNYNDLLVEVDAVSIVSPTSTHLAVGLAAINAKKNVLIEKPLASTYEEAKQLIECAEKNKILLTIGMTERYNPAFQKLAKLIRHEKILGLYFKRCSLFPERISDASVVFDMMIHDIDLAIMLAQSEIESIKATGKKERSNKLDQVIATLYFKNGLIAKLEASRVFGSRIRKIEASLERNNYEADLMEKKLFLAPSPIDKTEIPINSTDQLTTELKNFIHAIIDNKPLEVLPEQALEGIRIAEEIEKLAS